MKPADGYIRPPPLCQTLIKPDLIAPKAAASLAPFYSPTPWQALAEPNVNPNGDYCSTGTGGGAKKGL